MFISKSILKAIAEHGQMVGILLTVKKMWNKKKCEIKYHNNILRNTRL